MQLLGTVLYRCGNQSHVAIPHVLEEFVDSILEVWLFLGLNPTIVCLVRPKHARNFDAVFVVSEIVLPVNHTRDVLGSDLLSDFPFHCCAMESLLLPRFSQDRDLFGPATLSRSMLHECITESCGQATIERPKV